MRIFPFVIIIFCAPILNGQSKDGLKPCGTHAYKSPWLKQYQKNKENYPKSVGAEIFVPLNICIVGNDNGSGLFSETTMLESFCTLANDFSSTEISFYLQTYRNILDSEFFEHSDVLVGAAKMFEYDSDDAINCYILGNPAGNCGYNLPYAGIALSSSCTTPIDHTWAHELGHQFSLPHPFIGWEGGVGFGGEIDHEYSDPAPEYVLYDYTAFQDTLILDTLIIDTAFVELADGSNCAFAADGFCDTKADYLAERWGCDSDQNSYQVQHDPNGIPFNSDGTLFMSYSFDACASRFTDEQILAMRASLEEEDGGIIQDDHISSGEIIGNGGIELYQPLDEDLDFKDLYFSWSDVEHADYYLFQVLVGTGVFYDTLVTSTHVHVKELNSLIPWKWTVTPFNSHEFCNPTSGEILDLDPLNLSKTKDIYSNQTARLIPNVLSETKLMIVDAEISFDHYEIYSTAGMLVENNSMDNNEIFIDADLVAGLYFVRLRHNQQHITLKFILH